MAQEQGRLKRVGTHHSPPPHFPMLRRHHLSPCDGCSRHVLRLRRLLVPLYANEAPSIIIEMRLAGTVWPISATLPFPGMPICFHIWGIPASASTHSSSSSRLDSRARSSFVPGRTWPLLPRLRPSGLKCNSEARWSGDRFFLFRWPSGFSSPELGPGCLLWRVNFFEEGERW